MQVLLRALRDFNLGKLTADDTGIFMGLLNDLFPKTVELVPRAIDKEFEPKVRPAQFVIFRSGDYKACQSLKLFVLLVGMPSVFIFQLAAVSWMLMQPAKIVSPLTLHAFCTGFNLNCLYSYRSRRLLLSWDTRQMRPSASKSVSCERSLLFAGLSSCWALLDAASLQSGRRSCVHSRTLGKRHSSSLSTQRYGHSWHNVCCYIT